MATQKRETVLDFQRCLNQEVSVKFTGGREIVGILRGHDSLLNFVLDDCKEHLRDPADPYKILPTTRHLGRTVCRGGGVLCVIPTLGMTEMDDPFSRAPVDAPVSDD
ncbi:MAG: U6 snRNA-associated Sm-like protein LSm7 [archaeon]|nr:U6 snRNA-associated Sm-like protein LSm7 [archaeon]